MTVEKILVLEPGDILILQCPGRIQRENMEEEGKYLSEHLGIEVKIIDSRYKIIGVENG